MQMINSKVTDVLKMRTLNCIKECKQNESLDGAYTLTISASGSDSSYLQGIHLQ